MSTSSSTAGGAPAPNSQSSKNFKPVDWASFVPKILPSEDALSAEQCNVIWGNIANYAGFRSASEDVQKSIRLATYAYFARNGTSRDGDYSGVIKMSTGDDLPAADIKRAVGLNPRKFMRGCMEESYVALKGSKVMEQDQRFVAKAAAFGVSADCAFAISDWFDECSFFTPKEKAAHEAAKNHGLNRARNARGGMTLESVESGRLGEGLNAGRVSADSYATGPVTM